MYFFTEKLYQFRDLIEQNQSFLLISHRRPDADAIGANIAMRIALERIGKHVTSACVDPVTLDNYFLPRVYVYQKKIQHPSKYDVIITLDCGDSKITEYHKEYPDIWTCGTPVINIDHHATNDDFGRLNFVYPDAASTTHILFFLFRHMHWKIDAEMAQLLLAGLSFDTGHFRHDNTSPQVLEIAGKLIELGAKNNHLVRHMYRHIPVSTLKVWGSALKNMHVNEKNIVTAVIREEDVSQAQAKIDELQSSELITLINSVPGTKFALLLTEKKGLVKGSMRTEDDSIDVAAIAKKLFHGGGHKKAAGFAIKGKIIIDETGKKQIEEFHEINTKKVK